MKKSKTPNMDRIVAENPELSFLQADGFDAAIIGFDEGPPTRLKYSVPKMLEILVAEVLSKARINEEKKYQETRVNPAA